jgi:hypothetical protein
MFMAHPTELKLAAVLPMSWLSIAVVIRYDSNLHTSFAHCRRWRALLPKWHRLAVATGNGGVAKRQIIAALSWRVSFPVVRISMLLIGRHLVGSD